MSITHAKVSTYADGSDTSVIRPSDWNAIHTLSGITGCLICNTAAQTIPTTTVVSASSFSETYDYGNFFSSTANDRIIIPTGTNFVILTAQTKWGNESTVGLRYVTMWKNSTSSVGLPTDRKIFSDETEQNITSCPISVSPGDYFNLKLFQNSGTNVTCWVTMSAFKVG